MCKHKEKWPCLRTATPQPPACVQPWRVKPKGRACVWVCVSQVLGRMVEVKANIPLAVRAAWPVCYSPYVHLFCSLWHYVVVYRVWSWTACSAQTAWFARLMKEEKTMWHVSVTVICLGEKKIDTVVVPNIWILVGFNKFCSYLEQVKIRYNP